MTTVVDNQDENRSPAIPRRPSRDRKAGNLAGGGKFVAQIRRPRNRRYFLTNSIA